MADIDKFSRYLPNQLPSRVCEVGDFVFAAAHLNHGHIFGMCQRLIEAGGTLKWVYDRDPLKIEHFMRTYPSVQVARSENEILEDKVVQLVASAAVPSERAAIGIRVMHHEKDYFTDKAPLTTLEQLADVRRAVAATRRKYAVYYGERLNVESAVLAGYLVEDGVIGRVLQVLGMGPHRLNASSRPEWFFQKNKYGGILCDIGSHQIEQFLYYSGAKDARVVSSRVANYNHKHYPELEDFGDATLVSDNGSTNYFRVDWFTPDGLSTWGDGRTFILGTDGFIEMRKYIDIGRNTSGNHVYLVNGEGEFHLDATGRVGLPFFGQLILDCLNRTENAMSQEHALKAAELCVQAQLQASVVES